MLSGVYVFRATSTTGGGERQREREECVEEREGEKEKDTRKRLGFESALMRFSRISDGKSKRGEVRALRSAWGHPK